MEKKFYVIENNQLIPVNNLWDFVKQIAAELNASIIEHQPEPENIQEPKEVFPQTQNDDDDDDVDEDFGFHDRPVSNEKQSTDRYTANYVPFEDMDLRFAVGKGIITDWEANFLMRVKTFATVSGKQKSLAEGKLAALHAFYAGKELPSQKKYKG